MNIIKQIDKNMWSYVNDWADYRRNYICVRLFMALFFAMTIQTFILYADGTFISATFSLCLALMYLCSVYFFYIGKIVQTKNVNVVVSNVLLFIGASFYGRESHNYLSFIPLFGAIFFIYGEQEINSKIAMILLSLCSFMFLELTNYSLFVSFSDEKMNSEYNRWMVIFISVVFGFYMLYELLKINLHVEGKLKRWNYNLQVKNEKLKQSNEELDRFVYRVSHDLRAPLTSIMGVINIVKNEEDVSKVKHYMQYQEQSVKKLDDLIQDVLDISRNANLTIVIEKIKLKDFFEACIASFNYAEEFSRLQITLKIDPDLVLYSDSRRLKFVANNLISNAIRYHDSNKEPSWLVISAQEDSSGFTSIIVEDNGMGIQQEHQERVFDLFYRGTNSKRGSGLGLYIVKDSIEKLQGRILLESVYQRGTKITVVIPNAAAKIGH
jgi:signal transduction histidine kinase